MKPVTYWATAILGDAFLAGMFYLWQAHGIEQAVSVAVFWLWFLTFCRWVIGFNGDRTTFDKSPRPAGFMPYHIATEIVTISALVWFGFIWLPALYLFGALGMEAARNREPKAVAA